MADRIALSAGALLDAVDAGTPAGPAGRGSALLAAALPGLPEERREALTLAERDAWLLELRCGTFGDTLAARVTCPDCGLQLSVAIPRDHVALQDPPPAGRAAAPVVRLEEGPLVVEARGPDGRALAAAAATGDAGAARASLIAACVTSARRDGEPVDPLTLDAAVLERVGDAIVAAEPQTEVRVGMACAGCGREWSPVLDIVHFLWREVSAAAVVLLDEIHQLALAYGWSEEQVLGLPAVRRKQYVERLARG